MDKKHINELAHLTTPHLADGCLASGNAIRMAPKGILPLVHGAKCFGRARPVQHLGSIDVFFEAIENADVGDVMVVDNNGRLDEGPIGDIVTLECQNAGLAGTIIWGCHRDQAELLDLGYPVFSYGPFAAGPQRSGVRPIDVHERATIGPVNVTRKDFVVADSNGALFICEDVLEEVVDAAIRYRDIEAGLLSAMRKNINFRTQTRFTEYLAKREKDPTYDFRAHLKLVDAAGEA
jgi:regulator of RNase E activity RraA